MTVIQLTGYVSYTSRKACILLLGTFASILGLNLWVHNLTGLSALEKLDILQFLWHGMKTEWLIFEVCFFLKYLFPSSPLKQINSEIRPLHSLQYSKACPICKPGVHI